MTTLEVKRGPGHPKVDINWKKVDELLMAGCSGAQIASSFGISRFTLYDRCVTDNELEFSKYSQQKCEKGEALFIAHQYAKALGLTTIGDTSLLIHLGKTRFKQRETPIEIQQSLTVITQDYSNAKEHNPSAQIHPEALSDTSSEGA